MIGNGGESLHNLDEMGASCIEERNTDIWLKGRAVFEKDLIEPLLIDASIDH